MNANHHPKRAHAVRAISPAIAYTPRSAWIAALSALAVALAALIARADVVPLPAAADTFLYSSSPDNNAGGHGWFDAGTDGVGANRRGLIRFDLSAIPAGATVTSAVLRLTCVQTPGHGTSAAESTVDLRRLMAAWGEGDKAGNSGLAAGPGEATWNARLSGTENWTSAGAVADAAAAASASTAIGGTEGASYTWSGAGVVADVQAWVNGSAQNHGWLLVSQDEGVSRSVRAFGAREYFVAGSRPVLEVGFTAGGTGNNPPAVAIMSPANDATFTAAAMVMIEVDASDDDGSVAQVQIFDGASLLRTLTSIPYSIMTNFPAGNHALTAVATDDLGASSTSAVVNIVVTSAPNIPPTVAITNPTNNTTFATITNITIEATASDSDGTIMHVEFYDGNTFLDMDHDAPYTASANLGYGQHALFAVAMDLQGAMATSSVVNVRVATPPVNNPIAERIPKGDITIELKPVADGMVSPLGMATPNDGSGRMFVYDQVGVVWVVAGSGRLPTPLLDVRSRIINISGSYDERGLLGFAVHPGFSSNGLIYTYTSEPNDGPADFTTMIPPESTNNHQSVIAEWRVNPTTGNVADTGSRREVMRIDEPQSNHNGGTMRFGPDGLLYVSLGDGGAADDQGIGHSPDGNGQDTTNILGTVIRIDVDGRNSANGQYGVPSDNPFVDAPGVDEIYAYGLRNPFSFSFDRTSGLLYLGDVGQNRIEEINIIEKGSNYGWNLKEGTFFFDPNGTGAGYVTTVPPRPVPPDVIDPIAEYDHDDGTAVIGGYVYRGSVLPALSGRYVFGDWGVFGSPSGRLYYLDAANAVKELRLGLDDRPLGLYLKGFGEDTSGELYVFASEPQGPAGMGGIMFKIVPAPASALQATGSSITNGTNFNLTWDGGVGPYGVQRKARLDDPFCMNEIFTTNRAATVPMRNGAGFFRLLDTAQQPAVPFTAFISGANERPNPTASEGQGFGMFSLEGNTLTFTINYSGLTGPAIAAHIHGPSVATNTATVMIDLQPYHVGPFAAAGSFSGAIVLTEQQKATIMAGLTYVNIHTMANQPGEIRGQIAPVLLQNTLGSIYEPGNIQSPAFGFGSFTLIGTQLNFVITYQGFTNAPFAGHIHARAPFGQNAGVSIDLAPFNGGAWGTNGVISGSVGLNPNQLAAVVDGHSYVNLHTTANQGGEIRGQILPHITAVPMTAWISGLNERPTPLTNSAFGTGVFSLEGDKLAFNITYGGLTGPATMAHIHGPATTASSVGVMIDLAPYHIGPFGTSGAFSGTVRLTPAQRTAVLNGMTYFNVHTTAHQPGEARGQIASVLMSAGGTGTAERPAARAVSGSAIGLFNLVGQQLRMGIVYRDLTAAATMAHIHAPANASGTAGIVVDFAPFNGGAYGQSGSINGTATLDATVLGYLIDGLGYINIHTPTNGSGEVRGQILR